MQGGKVLMGGTHEGGHRRYRGGPNFDRLYHKLKVLLLLLLLLLCYCCYCYVIDPTLVIQLLLLNISIKTVKFASLRLLCLSN